MAQNSLIYLTLEIPETIFEMATVEKRKSAPGNQECHSIINLGLRRQIIRRREGGVVERKERRMKEGSKASLRIVEMGKTSLFPELPNGKKKARLIW